MLKTSAERIVVVGAGGTGSWLLPVLVRFLAAEQYKGEVIVADGDKFSEGNLLRQEFRNCDIGRNKAQTIVTRLRAEYLGLNVEAFEGYITDENITDFNQEGTIFILCVDNHGARGRITRLARTMENAIVICSGNEMFDGNVHIYVRKNGINLTNDTISDHPEIADGEESGRGDPTKACDFAVEGNTQLLVANFWSAAFIFASFHKLWILREPIGRRKKLELDQEINWNSLLLKCLPLEVPANVSANSN